MIKKSQLESIRAMPPGHTLDALVAKAMGWTKVYFNVETQTLRGIPPWVTTENEWDFSEVPRYSTDGVCCHKLFRHVSSNVNKLELGLHRETGDVWGQLTIKADFFGVKGKTLQHVLSKLTAYLEEWKR